MDEQPFDSDRPPDERWWERELHRNEKLMDKYMAVLGDDPDWDKWADPDDLYNKVHFDIDPPERAAGDMEEPDGSEARSAGDAGVKPTAESDLDADGTGEGSDVEDPDEDPEVNGNFSAIATQARRFALDVFDLKNLPGDLELLYLSAGKVGANLVGGHGLGYDDETICGNIVKCRWALSDCEFCREMFEQLKARASDPRLDRLLDDSRRLAEALRERITFLRQRVWW